MAEKKFIDIGKVIQDKSPKLKKWLPRFVVSWLKRKLHEDEINIIMHELKDVYGVDYNNGVIEKLGANVESINSHHIPKTGGIILAANHPLGGLDGMAFVKTIAEVRPEIKFVVNDVLKNLKNYGDVFIGINKIRTTSPTSLRTVESVLATDDAIGFFPAGLVSRKQNGVIEDLEWKKSFVTQAIDHKRLIVPVFIEGQNSKFFYRFANFRKRIGIKANIEMLFLPDEMFKQKGHHVRVHFGKPFDPRELDKSRSHKQWAAHIKKYIYSKEFKKGVTFEEFVGLVSQTL
ncbi:MAG: 1-acyl-sn-glycerol-3-phosphate acyltransferase [Bacteroidota bacterium]|nr:1-acyl-sn-glycerol-3-phosphate acyltransferase [Bacteroidota bacterium]